jgi:3D (Asp-Asp-Asp) domain-containing protein
LVFIGYIFYFLITLPKEWSFERQEVSELVLLGNNSLVGQAEPVVVIDLGEQTISAYSPKEGCTNPQCLMANGEVVHIGAVANNQYPLGTKVLIGGKNYVVKDRTAKRYSYRWDIFVDDYETAINFGLKSLTVEVLK